MLNHGGSFQDINDTFITLIPKIKQPKKITDYMPISMCNVIYKVVSKVLANRLKNIILEIISPNQIAYVLGCMNGKSGFIALKLVMSKAYDRVEWQFLEEVMRRLGFDRKWISLMMSCIRLVSYSLLINGAPHTSFIPTRWLR